MTSGVFNLLFFEILPKKCFKFCGCGSNGSCRNCDSSEFFKYDVYNSGSQLRYKMINSIQTAPNTTGLSCTSSNVEIQV